MSCDISWPNIYDCFPTDITDAIYGESTTPLAHFLVVRFRTIEERADWVTRTIHESGEHWYKDRWFRVANAAAEIELEKIREEFNERDSVRSARLPSGPGRPQRIPILVRLGNFLGT